MSDATYGEFDLFVWWDIIYRARLSHAAREVGLCMLKHADPDGTRVRPGVFRLAVLLNRDKKYVQAGIKELVGVGLIELVRSGRGRSNDKTDLYRLRIPVALLERVEVLDPAEVSRRAAALKERSRPRAQRAAAQLAAPVAAAEPPGEPLEPAQAPQTPPPVDNPPGEGLEPAQAPQTEPLEPVSESIGARPAGYYRSTTGSPLQPDGLGCGEGDSRARPNVHKCDHGLSGYVDKQGIPKCPLCRRGLSAVPATDPDPPTRLSLVGAIAS